MLLLLFFDVVALAVVIFCYYYCLWQTSWGRPGAQVVLVLVIAVVRFCCYDCSCCCCSCSCHLLLLLQLSYFVVITVCDQPPEEGLGLKLSLFLLWFWLSIFVVVDANLELRLLVFKQSCKAWCLNCCRSPEQRGLETAMADPNWKATSLWNRTQVQKVKVVQKQKPWLEKLSWLFWHKTLRSKKVIHNCQRTQSICGSSKMCEKQENKTQNSEYSYYVTLPYDGSMDVILNSISTAGETWNVHLWGKRYHSPHAYSVFFQCDPQFILRMVISWYATIMITIILLNIIEVIIDDATIVQPQGLFNLSSHVPRACIRHFHRGVLQCMNRFSGIYWSNDQTMWWLRLKCVSKYRSMQNIFEVNFAGAQAYYTLHCNYDFNWSCILIWTLNQISRSFFFFNFPSLALNCLKMFTVCFLARHCSAGIFCCNKRYKLKKISLQWDWGKHSRIWLKGWIFFTQIE